MNTPPRSTIAILPSVAAVAAGLLACADPADAAGTVYYQVVYADGTTKDLSRPPAKADRIDRVTRFTRTEPASSRYVVLSTGPQPVTEVNRGQTTRTQLEWNGTAWVAPEPAPTTEDQAGDPPATAPRSELDVIQSEALRLAEMITSMRKRLKELDHEVAEAERAVEAASADDARQAARRRAETARARRDELLTALRDYRTQMRALRDVLTSGALDNPSGTVAAGDPPSADDANVIGAVRPVTTHRVPAFRTQVWPLPAGEGERTYTVAIRHPEAGRLSRFRYLACADVNNDSRPDRLIALSPPAEADRPGGWTRWQFTTDRPRVFVGHTWPDHDVSIYIQPADEQQDGDWRGLGQTVYVSGYYGVCPTDAAGKATGEKFLPYLSNIRVHIPPNPGP